MMILASRPPRRHHLLVAALAMLCAACGTAGTSTTASRPTGPGAVESFMVVDCLLPGQIRQLGSQTFNAVA